MRRSRVSSTVIAGTSGDLVMWDNRAVLHTASLFDHTKYQRLMYRTTLAGNAPLLAA